MIGAGFRNRADLVELDKDGVTHALINALGQNAGVGHEHVVAQKLAIALFLSQIVALTLTTNDFIGFTN